MKSRISQIKTILLPLISVGIALLISMLLESVFLVGHSLYLFLAAVVLSGLYGGSISGVIAALLAVSCESFFFQYPRRSFLIHSVSDLIQLVLFLFVGIFLSWIGSQIRKARLEAEEATLQREDILAVVAHDLKNPLTSIKLTSDLALRYPKEQSSQSEKTFTTILAAANRMDQLISSLLDYEKIRAGKLAINLRKENVQALIQETRDLFLPLAHQKSINLEILNGPANLFINCDKERMHQVFSNLVGNALKFTPQNGTVSLSVEEKKFSVIFCIKDTGPGIQADQLSHIFDRYWQAKKTARLGTGLGLSIAKGIIDAHHGNLSVRSKFGYGTSFFFSLPK